MAETSLHEWINCFYYSAFCCFGNENDCFQRGNVIQFFQHRKIEWLGRKGRKQMDFERTVLGLELGSTRIKAVLIAENHVPLASGSFEW